MLIHREALELANLAPSEETPGKFALSCLHVGKSGHVTVCDGHLWLRVSGKVMEPSLLDVMLDEDDREQESVVLLSAEAARSFNAALKKRKVKKGEPKPHVVIAQSGEEIRVSSGDGRVTRKFVVEPPKEPFPDVDKLANQKRVIVKSVTVGIDVLMSICRTVKAVGCSSFTLDLAEGDNAAIMLSAYSLNVGHVEGMFMPRRDETNEDDKPKKTPKIVNPNEHQPELKAADEGVISRAERLGQSIGEALTDPKNPIVKKFAKQLAKTGGGSTSIIAAGRQLDIDKDGNVKSKKVVDIEPARKLRATHAARDKRQRRDPEGERKAQVAAAAAQAKKKTGTKAATAKATKKAEGRKAKAKK